MKLKPWKVQKFFGDVVYDLRNRNLLPVVILLVVAMVAVPVLISRGGGSSTSSSLQSASSPVKPDPHSESAVVSYTPPGLRKYQQRLSDQAPKDPFRQLFNNPSASASASQLNSTVTSPTTVSPSGSAPSSVSTGTVSPGTGSGSTKPRIVYYHSVADLSFGSTDQELTRHKKTQAFTMLPTPDTPVVIYLGSSLDGKHAYFSISTYTSQLTGPGLCAPGPTDCSLLALGPGQAEQMVYSGDGKTYALKINKINRVVSKKIPAG